mmetsp:Transcript_17193/g.19887  ORF Transcript_17193/g.19887 Transcript_17193/m.19887 type:complete len:130 (+) Transcript_17193:2-391(+)
MKCRLLIKVQSHIRGYFAWKVTTRLARELKLQQAFEYFTNIRQRLLEDAQIKIRYHWLKYIKNKKMKKKKKGKKKFTTVGSNSSNSSLVKGKSMYSVQVDTSKFPPISIASSTKKLPMPSIKEINDTVP